MGGAASRSQVARLTGESLEFGIWTSEPGLSVPDRAVASVQAGPVSTLGPYTLGPGAGCGVIGSVFTLEAARGDWTGVVWTEVGEPTLGGTEGREL